MRDAYQEVTNRLVEMMDDTSGKWKAPWHKVAVDVPTNAKSKTPYRGVNILMCWLTMMVKDYSSNRWATFKQWHDMGGTVKRGEKGTPIIFFKEYNRTNHQGEEEKVLVTKLSHVFNANQVDGECAAEPTPPQSIGEGERIKLIEQFIKYTNANVEHGHNQACYIPSKDLIHMPDFGLFKDGYHYYSVLFHELVHWTGAKNRLDRDLSTRFKSDAYAMEELVAELGAAFLAAEWKIENHTREDHARYLKSWLEVAKKDKMALFTAAAQASKAADFLEECWQTGQLEVA
jgi:antirestriction protein ArdC